MATAKKPPYEAYATIMSVFLGSLAVTGYARRRLRRESRRRTAFDLAVMSLATFKGARTLAHDDVASFIRSPFVEGAPDDPEDEHPLRTGGFRQALGELVTCSRCLGMWMAAGIAALDTVAPVFGRVLTWSLALGGVNDWLQAGFAALTGVANRTRES